MGASPFLIVAPSKNVIKVAAKYRSYLIFVRGKLAHSQPHPFFNGVVESLFILTVYLRIKDCSFMNIQQYCT